MKTIQLGEHRKSLPFCIEISVKASELDGVALADITTWKIGARRYLGNRLEGDTVLFSNVDKTESTTDSETLYTFSAEGDFSAQEIEMGDYRGQTILTLPGGKEVALTEFQFKILDDIIQP